MIAWEPRGYPIEITYRDDRGEPTRVVDGCAIVGMQYDGAGNVSEMRCMNEQGAPTISTSGFSSSTFTSDAFGNRLTSAFYDVQGAPRLIGDTYASIRRNVQRFRRR